MSNIQKIKKMLVDNLTKKLFKRNVFRSKPESDIYQYITDNHRINNRSVLNGKELDLYFPDHNFAIEYNGLYWHSYPFLSEENARYKHYNKTIMCDECNIRLLHIWEDERQPTIPERLEELKNSNLPRPSKDATGWLSYF